MKVLLVEDNIVNQELVVEMMGGFGCDLCIANDGFEAIERCKKDEFALILMDIQMPDMDGIQATKIIRELEAEAGRSPAPICALSANNVEGIEEQCMAAGMNGFQGKPFMTGDLESLVNQYCKCSLDVGASGSSAVPKLNQIDSDLSTQALDVTALDNIRALQREGAPDILGKIISIYFDTSPGQMQALQAAVSSQNAVEINHIAHSLKSSSANLGAISLSAILKKIEKKSRQNELDGIEQLMLEVDSVYPQVCQHLRCLC